MLYSNHIPIILIRITTLVGISLDGKVCSGIDNRIDRSGSLIGTPEVPNNRMCFLRSGRGSERDLAADTSLLGTINGYRRLGHLNESEGIAAHTTIGSGTGDIIRSSNSKNSQFATLLRSAHDRRCPTPVSFINGGSRTCLQSTRDLGILTEEAIAHNRDVRLSCLRNRKGIDARSTTQRRLGRIGEINRSVHYI